MDKRPTSGDLLAAYRAEIVRLKKEAESHGENRLMAENCLLRAKNLQASVDALETARSKKRD